MLALIQDTLRQGLECCERSFDQSVFFRRLAAGDMTPTALAYVFGQYGHFRLQLHRWFAVCMLLSDDASQPAQREAILGLADHVFTDLRDGHDPLFADLLQDLGFPPGTLRAEVMSPATAAYIESFLDHCRAPGATWVDAVAALGGRELSVVVRNQRLLKSYFAPRDLRRPVWITLHAELEADHFLDLVRPLLGQQSTQPVPPDVIQLSMARAIERHVDYLDALLQEHSRNSGD